MAVLDNSSLPRNDVPEGMLQRELDQLKRQIADLFDAHFGHTALIAILASEMMAFNVFDATRIRNSIAAAMADPEMGPTGAAVMRSFARAFCSTDDAKSSGQYPPSGLWTTYSGSGGLS